MGDVPVVREYPAAILKRVTVENRAATLGSLAHVREYGLGRDDAAQAMEERIAQGRGGAARDVRRAIDIEGNAPAVRVLIALDAERIFGGEQRAVNLARDNAAKAE